MENLILIGEIEKLFNTDATAKKYVKDAKFILVSTDNVTYKMIMHLERYPYEYHAQAVLKYMEDNNLNEIYSYGGAKIVLGTVDDVLCHGKSYALNTANNEKLTEVVKSIWPNAELQIMTSRPKVEEAMLFSKEQIQYFAEHH
jgi:hypothetical protein